MSLFRKRHRAPLVWLLPAWRDWWILSLLAIVLILAVQGYAAPRSLWISRTQNDPVSPQRIYCDDSSPSFGLPRIEFDPAGSYHQRRRALELSSAGGGIRVEIRAFSGHLIQSSHEPMPQPLEWYFDLDEPISAVDEVMDGAGCIIYHERIGWGMFAGQWNHYPGEHLLHLRKVPAPNCFSSEYWFSAPAWSLAAPPFFLMLVRTNRRRREWGRSNANLCRSCGYDLRATPDRCPECGRATAAS